MSTTDFAVFEALDLAPIKMKLMHVESGEGWSAMRASAVETEYRRFLFLMKKYPDAGASPTVDVDTFWHYHILDTMKYARDCQAAFGYFLHHYPYVGIGADAGEDEHTRAGERMREIYEAEFGSVPAQQAAWCASPGKQFDAAWCASPGRQLEAAWCASPGKQAGAAWCASPGKQPDAAWCASPGKQPGAAWCASPGKQAETAWCASPGKQSPVSTAVATAWCAAPGKKLATMIDTSAWCAAPGKAAASAWCASPGKPGGESANAANAWCASPGKQLALAA